MNLQESISWWQLFCLSVSKVTAPSYFWLWAKFARIILLIIFPLRVLMRVCLKSECSQGKWVVFLFPSLPVTHHRSNARSVFRKQHYVHNDALNWDELSSSGDYVRRHCQSLKVHKSLWIRQAAAAVSSWKPAWLYLSVLTEHADKEWGGAAAVRPPQLHAGVRRLQTDHAGGSTVAPVLQLAEDSEGNAVQLAHAHTHAHTRRAEHTLRIYLRLLFSSAATKLLRLWVLVWIFPFFSISFHW